MLKNVCERSHSGCPPKEMKIGAVCHPLVSLIFIFGWGLGAKGRASALSLGERVASVASRVRGYSVILDPVTPHRRATDPSPGPRPDEVHRDRGPLPLGEGLEFLHFSRGKDPTPSLSPGEESARSRSGWEGGRSQTFFSVLLRHPSFCLLLFAFRLLPSAFCFLPTAYFARPIPPARQPC